MILNEDLTDIAVTPIPDPANIPLAGDEVLRPRSRPH